MTRPPVRDVTGANAHRVAKIRPRGAKDTPRATPLAVDAGADGLSGPVRHHLAGLALKDQGRFEAAITEFGEGLALEPGNAGLTISVGFCLIELGRRQEAAQVFKTAMELDPSSAEACYGYGWAAERLGALEAADSAFRRAAALNPNHADALAGVSGLAARRRDWAVARSFADRSVALDPRQTDALMNLARVEIGEGRFAAARARLERLIRLPHLKPAARAASRILLGDALDGAALYEEAFAAYAAGKEELRTLHAAAFEGPGRTRAVQGVQRALEEFVATPASAWAAPVTDESAAGPRRHAFLVGFPRSGTTLLEQILATHPEVETLEERPAMLDAEVEFLTTPGGVARLAAVSPDALEPFRRSYWERARAYGAVLDRPVFIDKHPLGTVRLPLIHKVFPWAKIIFALRDPRDVILSCFRRNFNMNAAMFEFSRLEDAAKYYDGVMKARQIYLSTLDVAVETIRYEDLVADFEGTGGRLCRYLGVEWTSRLEQFAHTAQGRAIATPSSAQVARGLYADGVGQWRRYARQLEPVIPILAPWIESFGYAGD